MPEPLPLQPFANALLVAFPTPANLERLVRFGLNQNQHAIRRAAHLQTIMGSQDFLAKSVR